MSDSEPNINFIDAMTIKYECPKCGHPQKQTFLLKQTGKEMPFSCKKCNFKNSLIISEAADE